MISNRKECNQQAVYRYLRIKKKRKTKKRYDHRYDTASKRNIGASEHMHAAPNNGLILAMGPEERDILLLLLTAAYGALSEGLVKYTIGD